MSCTSPMHMAVIKFDDFHQAFHFKAMHHDNGWKYNLDTLRAYRIVAKNSRKVDIEKALKGYCHEIMEIPCGNCVNCRLSYSRDWANRCTFEAEQYEFNWFITLTYDDDHLHIGPNGNPTLSSDDYTNFVKAVRKKFLRKYGHVGVKMFGCGEYGETTVRPHLHIILFNCPLPDLTFNFDDGNGQISHHFDSRGVPYLYSQFIKDCWPHGNILIADCNWNTSAYVSQYVLKKQKGKNGKVYKAMGVLPPFLRMSNGIGLTYYEANKKRLADIPSLYVPREHKEPLKCGLPRYYRELLKRDGLIDYEQKIEEAKIAADKQRSLLDGRITINHSRQLKEEKLEAFNFVKERVAI